MRLLTHSLTKNTEVIQLIWVVLGMRQLRSKFGSFARGVLMFFLFLVCRSSQRFKHWVLCNNPMVFCGTKSIWLVRFTWLFDSVNWMVWHVMCVTHNTTNSSYLVVFSLLQIFEKTSPISSTVLFLFRCFSFLYRCFDSREEEEVVEMKKSDFVWTVNTFW